MNAGADQPGGGALEAANSNSSQDVSKATPADRQGPLSFSQALARGISLRCAICGKGRLFRDIIRMETHCSCCGFRFERAPGYFLGSTYINYGLTASTTTFSYVLFHFGLGQPNQRVVPVLLLFCAFFPVVFFRYARSLWLSLDCFFDRTGAEEAASETRIRQD